MDRPHSSSPASSESSSRRKNNFGPGKSSRKPFFTRGLLSFNFWIGEVLLGAIVPIVILLTPRLRHQPVLRMAGMTLIVGGVVAYRWDTNLVGQLVLLDVPAAGYYRALHRLRPVADRVPDDRRGDRIRPDGLHARSALPERGRSPRNRARRAAAATYARAWGGGLNDFSSSFEDGCRGGKSYSALFLARDMGASLRASV